MEVRLKSLRLTVYVLKQLRAMSYEMPSVNDGPGPPAGRVPYIATLPCETSSDTLSCCSHTHAFIGARGAGAGSDSAGFSWKMEIVTS